jgi:arylsulfatase A-like enzyme
LFPTRGSLLTGYNIHQIGTGIISEMASGYPGYNSQIDYTTPSIARILTESGYATAAFGKWHNTPMEEASPAGPFESWPTGIWGFEYFWGFLGGETNQFHPLLYENTTLLKHPKRMLMDQHSTYPMAWQTRHKMAGQLERFA